MANGGCGPIRASTHRMIILQTEWFAKNLITVIPAKAGIHSTHS
jgi:hypothetical protein